MKNHVLGLIASVLIYCGLGFLSGCNSGYSSFLKGAITEPTPAPSEQEELPSISYAKLPRFGVVTRDFRGNNTTTPITPEQNLQMLRDIGAQMVRLDVAWAVVEKNVGVFDFSNLDRSFQAMRAKGLKLMLILDYGHPVHTGAWNAPPKTTAQLAKWSAYVTAVANHYHGDDIMYEVWNEPNLSGYWGGSPSAAEYVAVLDAATAALRAVRPEAYIITGGLSPAGIDPIAYISYIAQHADMSRINAIGYHFYTTADWAPWASTGFNTGEENAPNRPETLVTVKNNIINALGEHADKDIINTEAGFPLQHCLNLSENRQGILISRLLLSSVLGDIGGTIMYDLVNDGTNAGDSEHTYGLHRHDFTRKPSGYAFKSISRAFKDAITVEKKITGSLYEITIKKTDRIFHIAWTTDTSRPYTATFSEDVKTSVVRDVLGNPVPKFSNGKTVSVGLQGLGGPVIFEVNGPDNDYDFPQPTAPYNLTISGNNISFKASSEAVTSYVIQTRRVGETNWNNSTFATTGSLEVGVTKTFRIPGVDDVEVRVFGVAMGIAGVPSPTLMATSGGWWRRGMVLDVDLVNGTVYKNGVSYSTIAAAVAAGVYTQSGRSTGDSTNLTPPSTGYAVLADGINGPASSGRQYLVTVSNAAAVTPRQMVFLGKEGSNAGLYAFNGGTWLSGVVYDNTAAAAGIDVRHVGRVNPTHYSWSYNGNAMKTYATTAARPVTTQVVIGEGATGADTWKGSIKRIGITSFSPSDEEMILLSKP